MLQYYHKTSRKTVQYAIHTPKTLHPHYKGARAKTETAKQNHTYTMQKTVLYSVRYRKRTIHSRALLHIVNKILSVTNIINYY
jgi:hypothetical protein